MRLKSWSPSSSLPQFSRWCCISEVSDFSSFAKAFGFVSHTLFRLLLCWFPQLPFNVCENKPTSRETLDVCSNTEHESTVFSCMDIAWKSWKCRKLATWTHLSTETALIGCGFVIAQQCYTMQALGQCWSDSSGHCSWEISRAEAAETCQFHFGKFTLLLLVRLLARLCFPVPGWCKQLLISPWAEFSKSL